jgi:hypothetical protein
MVRVQLSERFARHHSNAQSATILDPTFGTLERAVYLRFEAGKAPGSEFPSRFLERIGDGHRKLCNERKSTSALVNSIVRLTLCRSIR